MSTLTTALLVLATLAAPLPPEPEHQAPMIDLQFRLVQFLPGETPPTLREVPLLGTLLEPSNPDGEALARIPGISMNVPVSKLFVDRDHYTLTCRDADVDALLRNAAKASDTIQFLSAPRLLVLAGQQASVHVGQPVHFLTRTPDGCLEVAQDDKLREGLEIELQVGEASATAIAFDHIRVRLSEVLHREPLPDVPFDLGRPTIATRQTEMVLQLKPNQVGVFPVARTNREDLPVLLFLTAKVVDGPDTTGR